MEIFLFSYLFLFASCIFENSTLIVKKKVLFFWMIYFTLLGGLRWDCGFDWEQYYGYFKEVKWGIDNIMNFTRPGVQESPLEPGFVLLNLIVKTLFGEYWMFNVIMGFFVQYSYYRFCLEFSPRRPIMMYVLIIGMGVTSYTFVRTGLAVAICYWGYVYVRDRQLRKFILVVLAGSLVHRQVLAFLPFYWMGKFQLKWWVYIGAYVMCMFLYVALQDYITLFITLMESDSDIAARLQMYTNEDVGINGTEISYFKWIMYLGMLCFFIYVRKLFNLGENEWYNCILAGFFIIIVSITLFTEGMSTLGRVTAPYKPARTLLIMFAVNEFLKYKKTKYKLMAYFLFWGMCVFNIYKDLTAHTFHEYYIPYTTIFD